MRQHPPRVVLFPMIHVAEPEFYADVAARLECCDIIILEGVRALTVSLITLSYRFFAGSARLGLVAQHTMNIKHLKDRFVRGDMDGGEFQRKWSALPILTRLPLLLAAPFFGLYIRYFGTRATIANRLETTDLTSRNDLMYDERSDRLLELVRNARDKVVVERLAATLADQPSGEKTIGVVYGAKHMPAILAHLTRMAGYRIVKREFATVMTL